MWSGDNTVAVTATDNSPRKNTVTQSWRLSVPPLTTSFLYDRDGNLLDDGVRTCTWDGAGRLAGVKLKTGSGTPPAGATGYTFVYNAAGQRVSETLNGATTRRWVWEPGAATPAAELNAAGDAVVKRFYAAGESRRNTDGSYASFYYTRDHLGSMREVVNTAGALVARYDFDAYGRRTTLGADAFGADFGYTGHFTHAPTGLVLTLFRAYDPESGRWLSRDPIWESGGMNLYGYVGGGPLMGVDPLGLDCAVVDSGGFIPHISFFVQNEKGDWYDYHMYAEGHYRPRGNSAKALLVDDSHIWRGSSPQHPNTYVSSLNAQYKSSKLPFNAKVVKYAYGTKLDDAIMTALMNKAVNGGYQELNWYSLPAGNHCDSFSNGAFGAYTNGGSEWPSWELPTQYYSSKRFDDQLK